MYSLPSLIAEMASILLIYTVVLAAGEMPGSDYGHRLLLRLGLPVNLSTIRAVDRIIVLDHGRIVEEGSHDALLRKGEPHGRLYNIYSSH